MPRKELQLHALEDDVGRSTHPGFRPRSQEQARRQRRNERMTKYALACALIMAYPASAEVQFGSVAVIDFAKDHLVVAADSRSRYGINGPINDSTCKIAAFNHQVIFTNVGYPAYTKISLLNRRELGQHRGSLLHNPLSPTVCRWGRSSREYCNRLGTGYYCKVEGGLPAHREDITLWAEQNKGQLTAGAFAEVKNGRVYFRVAVIVLDVAAIERIRFVLIKTRTIVRLVDKIKESMSVWEEKRKLARSFAHKEKQFHDFREDNPEGIQPRCHPRHKTGGNHDRCLPKNERQRGGDAHAVTLQTTDASHGIRIPTAETIGIKPETRLGKPRTDRTPPHGI